VSRTHTITFSASSVTVSPGDDATLKVTLSVKASEVGSADGFREVAGAIKLTPAALGMNNDVSLRVPYLMIPRARSNVATTLSAGFGPDSSSGTATVTNANGARSGSADFYAWGLQGSNAALGDLGIRAVGVHLDPAQVNPANNTMTFAVNTFGRFNTPDVTEYDIVIDTTGTGTANKVLVAIDLGKFAANSYNGAYFTFLCDLPNGDKCKRQGLAKAPFNGSTILMPVKLSALALPGNPYPLDAEHPRFTYTAESFDLKGDRGYASDSVSGPGKFNAFTPAIYSSPVNVAVPPGAAGTATVSINSDEWDETRALGLMIVTTDNRAGAPQAQLIPVR
jgi:hypothetical protein